MEERRSGAALLLDSVLICPHGTVHRLTLRLLRFTPAPNTVLLPLAISRTEQEAAPDGFTGLWNDEEIIRGPK